MSAAEKRKAGLQLPLLAGREDRLAACEVAGLLEGYLEVLDPSAEAPEERRRRLLELRDRVHGLMCTHPAIVQAIRGRYEFALRAISAEICGRASRRQLTLQGVR